VHFVTSTEMSYWYEVRVLTLRPVVETTLLLFTTDWRWITVGHPTVLQSCLGLRSSWSLLWTSAAYSLRWQWWFTDENLPLRLAKPDIKAVTHCVIVCIHVDMPISIVIKFIENIYTILIIHTMHGSVHP